MTPALVGSLAGGFTASVDTSGALTLPGQSWGLRWLVGADDRWHDPARERAVRQVWVGDVPVVQTDMRVPGGDVGQRVFGVAGPTSAVVVEIENASPLPAVIAMVVERAQSIALDQATVTINGSVALSSLRPPGRWATEPHGRHWDGGLGERVISGVADSGPFAPVRDRRGRVVAAFLYPLSHRTVLRFTLGPGGGAEPGPPIATSPSAPEVVRGWDTWLDRGLRAVLPDDALSGAVRRGLSASVLAAGTGTSAAAVAALEDWGFDAEAEHGWARLSMRARREATRRAHGSSSWNAVRAAVDGGGPELLLALRSLLASERDGVITVLAELPPGWAGAPIEVHGLPTKHGPLSYALRWHGARPALLWDAPAGLTIRAPGLDPAWSTTEHQGEVLLAAPLATTGAG
jgi:hypothetical protein